MSTVFFLHPQLLLSAPYEEQNTVSQNEYIVYSKT